MQVGNAVESTVVVHYGAFRFRAFKLGGGFVSIYTFLVLALCQVAHISCIKLEVDAASEEC